MPSKELTDYISSQRAQGISDEAIREALIKAGWQQDQIAAGITSGVISESEFNGKLPGPIELLSRSFQIYRSLFWKFIGLMLFPVTVIVGLIIVGGVGLVIWSIAGKPENTVLSFVAFAAVIVVALAMYYLMFWQQAALFQLALLYPEKIGIRAVLARSRHKVNTFFWTGMFFGLMTFVGFILFIIPGIIFFIWYFFAHIIVIAEEKKIFASLQASREYVRGRWWGVFSRLLVAYLILFIAPSLVELVNDSEIVEFVIALVQIILLPIMIIYTVLLYKNARALTDPQKVEEAVIKIKGLKLFAILSIFLSIIGIVAVIFAVHEASKWYSPFSVLDQLRKTNSSELNGYDRIMRDHQMYIQGMLSSYYEDYGYYPGTLRELYPAYTIKKIPVDLTPDSNHQYSVNNDRSSYTLCTRMEYNSSPNTQLEVCVKPNQTFDDVYEQ